MTPKQIDDKVDPKTRELAAEWFVAFCEGEVDATGRQKFDRWLRTSPEHVRAYLRISALWEGAGLLVESTGASMRDLVQRARSENHVQALAVDNFPSSPRRTSSQQPKASTAWRAIAASVLLVSAVAGGIAWWRLTRTPMYETGAAEQRQVRLPDGSTVQLDARSRIELHFTRQERAVDLVEGQALFSVAKDPRRAFVVGSDDAHVKALGTRFDVYRKSGGTIITVIEGQVAIRLDNLPTNSEERQGTAASVPASPVLVSAGEQAVASSRSPMRPYRANVFAATAWTEGKLVFDSAPLREVVAEFNRIGLRRLVVEDRSLLDLHISGVFPAADPSQLVGFLSERFGVTVTETNEEMRVRGTAHK